MTEDSQRMTTEEVAAFLGINVRSVYIAVYRGRLRKARRGRSSATFDRADVEAYLFGRRRADRPDPYWILGVTPSWVRALYHRGRLPGVRHDTSRLLFRRQQIEVIANARTAPLLVASDLPSPTEDDST